MLAIGMDSVFILFTHFHKSLESVPNSPLTDSDIHLALEVSGHCPALPRIARHTHSLAYAWLDMR